MEHQTVSGENFLKILFGHLSAKKALEEKQLQLSLNPSCLRYLNAKLASSATTKATRPGDLSRSELLDLKFLLESVTALKIEPTRSVTERELLEMDLKLFKGLRILEITKYSPSLLSGFETENITAIVVRSGEAMSSCYQLLGAPEPLTEKPVSTRWKNLTVLDVSHNHIVQMDDSLTNLNFLQRLDMSHNKISVIKNLQCCYALEYLDLGFNKISDIKNLADSLGNVKTLILQHNEIRSFFGLQNMKGLEKCDLSTNLVSGFEEIYLFGTLPFLRAIWLKSNPIELKEKYREEVFLKSRSRGWLLLDGKPPGSSEMKAIKENREKNSAHIKAVTNIRPTPSSTPKKKPIHREKRTAQIDEEAVPEEAPPTLVPQREGPADYMEKIKGFHDNLGDKWLVVLDQYQKTIASQAPNPGSHQSTTPSGGGDDLVVHTRRPKKPKVKKPKDPNKRKSGGPHKPTVVSKPSTDGSSNPVSIPLGHQHPKAVSQTSSFESFETNTSETDFEENKQGLNPAMAKSYSPTSGPSSLNPSPVYSTPSRPRVEQDSANPFAEPSSKSDSPQSPATNPFGHLQPPQQSPLPSPKPLHNPKSTNPFDQAPAPQKSIQQNPPRKDIPEKEVSPTNPFAEPPKQSTNPFDSPNSQKQSTNPFDTPSEPKPTKTLPHNVASTNPFDVPKIPPRRRSSLEKNSFSHSSSYNPFDLPKGDPNGPINPTIASPRKLSNESSPASPHVISQPQPVSFTLEIPTFAPASPVHDPGFLPPVDSGSDPVKPVDVKPSPRRDHYPTTGAKPPRDEFYKHDFFVQTKVLESTEDEWEHRILLLSDNYMKEVDTGTGDDIVIIDRKNIIATQKSSAYIGLDVCDCLKITFFAETQTGLQYYSFIYLMENPDDYESLFNLVSQDKTKKKLRCLKCQLSFDLSSTIDKCTKCDNYLIVIDQSSTTPSSPRLPVKPPQKDGLAARFFQGFSTKSVSSSDSELDTTPLALQHSNESQSSSYYQVQSKNEDFETEQINRELYLRLTFFGSTEEKYVHMFQCTYVPFGTNEEKSDIAVNILLSTERVYILTDHPEHPGEYVLVNKAQLSEIAYITVGLFFQYVRIESENANHVFITRSYKQTFKIVTLLNSAAKRGTKKHIPVLNKNHETLLNIGHLIADQNTTTNNPNPPAGPPPRPVIECYIMVYERVMSSKYPCSIPVPGPVVPRTLILTNNSLMLCNENLSKWPTLTARGPGGKKQKVPQFTLTQSKQSIQDVIILELTPDIPNYFGIVFEEENNPDVVTWNLIAHTTEEKEKFIKRLGVLWEAIFQIPIHRRSL